MTFDADTAYNELYPHFRERISRNESLAHHASFGVGGPADVWVAVETQEELKGLVTLCAQYHWPLLIVGNGTNVLYADAGVRGIVAHTSLSKCNIEERGDGSALLLAEAGVSWPHLLHELAPLGWGGLEFGVGIPGTLGGGVISNAGAHNADLGQVLAWIEVLDARGSGTEDEDEITLPIVRRYEHDELDLSYRHSRFRERTRIDALGRLVPVPRAMIEPSEIVLLLAINVRRDDPQKLQALIAHNLDYRKKTEPAEQHTGMIFKDPVGDEAARLISEAGLKGLRYSQAQISTLNPNFIVNLGGARASDVAALITEAHRRVLEKLGVDLEVEVELRGEWTA